MELGTVISTLNGPSTTSFSFVVNGNEIHKGQFVEASIDEGKLIGMIVDLFKTNRYFERADSVKSYESTGKNINDFFPTSEWEYLVAEVRPMGVYKSNLLSKSTYPVSPGNKINLASDETLKMFLGFDLERGLNIGKLDYHDVPVSLNLSKLFQKHLAILAMSGAGKSHLASVLFEEILSRTKEQGRIASIIFDVHGEYVSLAQPPKDSNKLDISRNVNVIPASDIKIGVSNLSASILSSFTNGISSPQQRELARVISSLQTKAREGEGPYGMSTLIDAVSKDELIKENVKSVLLSHLYSLDSLKLFSAVDNPSIADFAQPGKTTVINLSNIIDVRKKQLIVAYIANKAFNEKRANRIPPTLLVLEEAHQFIPESAKQERAVAKKIFETIAREGRKFGVSLCLISQRPIQLSTTVLSQCNTHVILRVTNPYDLDHIGKSSEGLDRRALDMITSLRVGEALIVGEAVNFPVFFKVRERKTEEGMHGRNLEDSARFFEEKTNQLEKDAQNFM
ncbi:MAG: ATP-binding protein [Candidatus Diapherotrites archaeon]|nr:ATP-binding protein [Candidatus Diapherotrites archaeon]